jgi:alkanesulfonate monooxygenase SsuD/methylene tetrahydromethanopterin reductase-like flavin-dependent oxidoreductase (luciferase family)
MNAKDFDLTVAWQGATIEALNYIASEADNLGFGCMWIPEAWGLECFSTASYLLCKTSKLRIGSGIVNVFSRSAALIGMSCATLDQIAPGRFVLGLGSSGKILVESFHGVKFSEPLERTKEYVSVIRKVASGANVDFDGELLKLSKFRLFTKPVRTQEIYLGAMGDKNLQLAGEICDGAILTMYPLSRIMEASQIVGETKKLLVYLPTFVSSSKEELEKAKHVVAKNIAFYISSMGEYYHSNLRRLGYGAEVAKIINAHKEMGSAGAVLAISEKLLDDLTLIGSQDEVEEKIAKLPKNVRVVLTFSVKSDEEVMSAISSLRAIGV